MDRHDNNFQQDSKWFVGKMLYTSFKLDNFSFDTFLQLDTYNMLYQLFMNFPSGVY